MRTKIYWLHQFESSAKLGIMGRPCGNEQLEDEILHLKKQNVHVLVSLLESEEIYELGLRKQKNYCEEQQIEYFNFPIADRNIPQKSDKIEVFIQEMVEKINKGFSVVIHCRMGIGRSSIIAGYILLKLGWQTDKIMDHIGKIRGVKVPDTPEQMEWLRNLV